MKVILNWNKAGIDCARDNPCVLRGGVGLVGTCKAGESLMELDNFSSPEFALSNLNVVIEIFSLCVLE